MSPIQQRTIDSLPFDAIYLLLKAAATNSVHDLVQLSSSCRHVRSVFARYKEALLQEALDTHVESFGKAALVLAFRSEKKGPYAKKQATIQTEIALTPSLCIGAELFHTRLRCFARLLSVYYIHAFAAGWTQYDIYGIQEGRPKLDLEKEIWNHSWDISPWVSALYFYALNGIGGCHHPVIRVRNCIRFTKQIVDRLLGRRNSVHKYGDYREDMRQWLGRVYQRGGYGSLRDDERDDILDAFIGSMRKLVVDSTHGWKILSCMMGAWQHEMLTYWEDVQAMSLESLVSENDKIFADWEYIDMELIENGWDISRDECFDVGPGNLVGVEVDSIYSELQWDRQLVKTDSERFMNQQFYADVGAGGW